MKIPPEQRMRIVERSSGVCEDCGQGPDWRGLAVHHTVPKGMGRTRRFYGDEDLRVLCGRCHSLAHHIREGRGDD